MKVTKNNYSTYNLELHLSDKILFPAELITLYPVYDENEIYEIKDPRFERLPPKDEWDIMKKAKLLIGISTGHTPLTKEMLSSLYSMPIEKISDRDVAHMQKEFKEIQILSIGKIVKIEKYEGGVSVKISANAKEKERIGKSEIRMVKEERNTKGDWMLRHVSGVR